MKYTLENKNQFYLQRICVRLCALVVFLFAVQTIKAQSGNVYNLNKQFEVETPSGQQLGIFEKRAEEKLKDLEGYINLIRKESTDDKMREQLKEMVRSVFETDNSKVPVRDMTDTKKKRKDYLTVATFTELSAEEILLDELYNFQDIMVNKNLREKKSGSGLYEGELLFTMNYALNGKIEENIEMKCQIVLVKKNVEFGSSQKELWRVFLGDIEPVR